MKSAWGIEHGEVSKGLKPANMKILENARWGRGLKHAQHPSRASAYADAKHALRSGWEDPNRRKSLKGSMKALTNRSEVTRRVLP